MASTNSVDVVIVGAGFSGLYMLNKLRKRGFTTKVYESGSGLVGTWYWNRYPGARVDSDFTFHQFSQDDLWEDFEWTERFPGQAELERYFEHLHELNLSKDITFNTTVTSAAFSHSNNQWLVKTNVDGIFTCANTLILCIGSSDFSYLPLFPGMKKFKGITCHTRLWPADLNVAGKRVAVIGTGSSGIQVIQEIASEVKHLTVYQRTPNMALPMQQSSVNDQRNWKFPSREKRQEILAHLQNTFFGLDMEPKKSNSIDATPDERCTLFKDLFYRDSGGFNFVCSNFQDVLLNRESNNAVYEFWCAETRARINDPIKRDILAPLTPPHPFGAKRCSLEQRYYEVFNQQNVDIIDVRKSPIIEITEKGVRTAVEGEIDVDIIVLATGFDALTGSMLNIDIKTDDNKSLRDKWKLGVWTKVGMVNADFPNMFFLYGPQAPTSFANGRTIIEVQGECIAKLLDYMKNNNKRKIVATEEAQRNWKKTITDIWDMTLCSEAESWYQGANIPGKTKEPLLYMGGIPQYRSILEDSAENDYSGFVLTYVLLSFTSNKKLDIVLSELR